MGGSREEGGGNEHIKRKPLSTTMKRSSLPRSPAPTGFGGLLVGCVTLLGVWVVHFGPTAVLFLLLTVTQNAVLLSVLMQAKHKGFLLISVSSSCLPLVATRRRANPFLSLDAGIEPLSCQANLAT